MSASVQVTFEPEELDRVRRRAQEAHQSVSVWVRDAAVKRTREEPPRPFQSVEELDEFFAAWDARQGPGTEPDWEETKRDLSDAILCGLPTDV